MPKHQRVTFAGRGGPELEGLYHWLEGPGRWPAAVVCHPHPQGGGSMHNNVVLAVARALAEHDILALRFNFRGVMGSGGEYDEGRAEQQDVAAALDWLAARPEVDPERLFLAGYSFGAWVGVAEAVGDARVRAVATVGLVPWRFEDAGRSPDSRAQFAAGFMQSFTQPKLFIGGEHDDLAPPQALRTLVDRLPPPKELRILPGTDHFFRGREAEVGELVAEFFSRQI